jgi:hypothetical protein
LPLKKGIFIDEKACKKAFNVNLCRGNHSSDRIPAI